MPNNWLKRADEQFSLYQSSDLPYLALDDGLRLCFDNYYYGCKQHGSAYSVGFRVKRSSVRPSEGGDYYELRDFPSTIPYGEVLFLHGQKGYRRASFPYTSSPERRILVTKAAVLEQFYPTKIADLAEEMSEYDQAFLLIDDQVDESIRTLSECAITIPHVSWPRTCVTIADSLSSGGYRGKKWTSALPSLAIDCHGLEDTQEMDTLNSSFELIGLEDCSVSWKEW